MENALLPILKMFDRVVQQSLARLLNSGWHDSSAVTGTIAQQSLERLLDSGWHDHSTVTGNSFSFFYAGTILNSVMLTVEALCHVPG